jgi:hypothetical protein
MGDPTPKSEWIDKVDSQLVLRLGFLTFLQEADPMLTAEREQKITELWADVAMPVQNVILNANLVAREIARHRDRASWLEVGKGWVEIRDEALRRAETQNIWHPRYRYYRGLLMAKAPDLAALEEHDHAGCRHAVWLFENWTVIERWLADQEIGKNLRDLNHPSVIKRRFDAAHRREPQGLKKPPTAAARKEARIHELEAENRELQTQLRRSEYEPQPLDTAATAVHPRGTGAPDEVRHLESALEAAEAENRQLKIQVDRVKALLEAKPAVNKDELAEKLWPIAEHLKSEGKKSTASSTISAARTTASQLAKLLGKEWGVAKPKPARRTLRAAGHIDWTVQSKNSAIA